MNRYTDCGSSVYQDVNNVRLRNRDDADIRMNNRFDARNHKKNVNRLEMERDGFNRDSNIDDTYDDYGRRQDKRRMGEITGQDISSKAVFDKGMPVRSQYHIKKPIYNEAPHLDFELFDEKEVEDTDIDYYDPGASGSGGYSDIHTSMNIMSSQIDSKSVCSKGIESLGFFLLNNMIPIIDQSFVINSIGLYNIFGALYMASKGNTEVELKNYFSYPKRDTLYKGLAEMTDGLESISKHIKFGCYILFSNRFAYNTKFYDFIRVLTDIKRVNSDNLENESMLINKLINRMMERPMKNMVTPDNLNKMDIILLNSSVITPIWKQKFDYVDERVFKSSHGNMRCEYMTSVGKTHGYYEDSKIQIVELCCAGDKLTMGIIIAKELEIPKLNEERIHFYIQHLKPTILDEVSIPMFKTQTKLRYTNILKKTELKTVFMDLDIPEFISDGCKLDDVIQNIEIIISNKSINNNEVNRGYRTIRKFVASTSFIYYFRYAPTNTIITLGIYA